MNITTQTKDNLLTVQYENAEIHRQRNPNDDSEEEYQILLLLDKKSDVVGISVFNPQELIFNWKNIKARKELPNDLKYVIDLQILELGR